MILNARVNLNIMSCYRWKTSDALSSHLRKRGPPVRLRTIRSACFSAARLGSPSSRYLLTIPALLCFINASFLPLVPSHTRFQYEVVTPLVSTTIFCSLFDLPQFLIIYLIISLLSGFSLNYAFHDSKDYVCLLPFIHCPEFHLACTQ